MGTRGIPGQHAVHAMFTWVEKDKKVIGILVIMQNWNKKNWFQPACLLLAKTNVGKEQVLGVLAAWLVKKQYGRWNCSFPPPGRQDYLQWTKTGPLRTGDLWDCTAQTKFTRDFVLVGQPKSGHFKKWKCFTVLFLDSPYNIIIIIYWKVGQSVENFDLSNTWIEHTYD